MNLGLLIGTLLVASALAFGAVIMTAFFRISPRNRPYKKSGHKKYTPKHRSGRLTKARY